ncbi:hypothetical protein GIB67_016435, partial [Kingdonia uniflora]
MRDLKVEVQLHCLALKTGFDVYVYTGSSLISLYSRCGDLDSSYNVFDKMSVRNVVTWTTMIASFAQHWEIEMCLELYHRMRCSALKPNNYTLTSLFSTCAGTGVLGHGKIVHGQTIRMGFGLYTHVANEIISMVLGQGKIVKNRGLKTYPRNSWIELRNEVYRFGAGGILAYFKLQLSSKLGFYCQVEYGFEQGLHYPGQVKAITRSDFVPVDH